MDIKYTNSKEDVPSPIDLRNEDDARAWADEADRARPWREQFRMQFAECIRALARPTKILEIGCGPGFLAERVLEHCANVSSYSLFDFSEPMLEMSRIRLNHFAHADFILGNFKSPDWASALQPPYTAVLAMQSVHEIRHKRHVPSLYKQIHGLLEPSGMLLVCDHIPKDSSLRWTSLHMTADEQLKAMSDAGFVNTRVVLEIERLVLLRAEKPVSHQPLFTDEP